MYYKYKATLLSRFEFWEGSISFTQEEIEEGNRSQSESTRQLQRYLKKLYINKKHNATKSKPNQKQKLTSGREFVPINLILKRFSS